MTTPAPASVASRGSNQAAQSALALLIARDVQQAFAQLDPANLRATLPTFTQAMHALTTRYGQASSALAIQLYAAERRAAGVTAPYRAVLANPPPMEQVLTVTKWATRKLWTEFEDLTSVAGAETMSAGAAQKMSLDTGRGTTIQTVRSDRYAKGWAREAQPGCCWFCAMLATRPLLDHTLYTSKQAAGPNQRSADHPTRAGESFVGEGQFKVHDHCRCQAVPVFTAYEPPARTREWAALYESSTKHATGVGKQDAFRAAFESAFPAPTGETS